MQLKDLEAVQTLNAQHIDAVAVLRAFEAAANKGTTICEGTASVGGGFSGRRTSVTMLPIPIDQAISAAKREVSKIEARLHELGVEV